MNWCIIFGQVLGSLLGLLLGYLWVTWRHRKEMAALGAERPNWFTWWANK